MDNKTAKGTYQENRITKKLKTLPGYKRCLNNVVIPSKHGGTEIDVVMIHEKGVFVLESKNFSGWIFGCEEDQQWTQCLPSGKKNSFYNPMRQNKGHTSALKSFLGESCKKIYSYIVFSDECTFKSTIQSSQNHRLVHLKDLLNVIKADFQVLDNIYSKDQVDEIYDRLKEYACNNNESTDFTRVESSDIILRTLKIITAIAGILLVLYILYIKLDFHNNHDSTPNNYPPSGTMVKDTFFEKSSTGIFTNNFGETLLVSFYYPSTDDIIMEFYINDGDTVKMNMPYATLQIYAKSEKHQYKMNQMTGFTINKSTEVTFTKENLTAD